jgi:GDP-L-fucose synthase
MKKDSVIYVAGHAGLVGSGIVRELKKQGFFNLVLPSHKELDLLDKKEVEDFFIKQKPEYVFMAAAKVGGIAANMASPALFLYENLEIQNNVIWAAFNHGVKKLLFLGSSCIYPRLCPQPMVEESILTGPFEPTNEGYAVAKIAGLKLCEKIFMQYGREFFSCLPSNIYGIGDHFDSSKSHVIPALISKFHNAKKENHNSVTVWGTGEAKREFLYVDDLADALVFMMSHFTPKPDDLNLVTYLNIGAGNDLRIKELCEKIKQVVGFTGDLIFDTLKPDGMPQKLLDISKIKALGWLPKTNLEDGLQKTYSWYLENLV